MDGFFGTFRKNGFTFTSYPALVPLENIGHLNAKGEANRAGRLGSPVDAAG